LTSTWRTFEIRLEGRDLSSVICPLEVLVLRDQNPGNKLIQILIDDIRYEVE